MVFSFRNDPGADGAGVAFTDREGGASSGSIGALNLGRTDADDLVALRMNLATVRAALRIGPVVTVHQVHGTGVLDVDDNLLRTWTDDSWLGNAVPGAERLRHADALVTTVRDVALAVRVADCLPVLFADPDAGVVAAAHAGRVGLAAGVLPATLARLTELGASRVTAWIGPHICGACYEVPEEMRDSFAVDHPAAATTTSWGTPSLDLGAAAEEQLVALGCTVELVGGCTRESLSLHSHRRDGAGAGRQAGLVWLP